MDIPDDQGVARAFDRLCIDQPRMIHLQGDSILVSTGTHIPNTTTGLDFADPTMVRLVTTTRFGNVATPVDATDAANKDYVDRIARPFVVRTVITGRPQKMGDVTIPLGVTLSTARESNGYPSDSLTHAPRGCHCNVAYTDPHGLARGDGQPGRDTSSAPVGPVVASGTTDVTLRYPQCNYAVVGRLPGSFRYDVSYMEMVTLFEPTFVGVLITTARSVSHPIAWAVERSHCG